ncbi:MAG TPA: Tricorn protease like protein [Microscillaceae bacterium]|nr:Tricorn protease like protein [Microscillaceae bacterium]
MKNLSLIFLLVGLTLPGFGQINAKLMRYMDVSDTQIAFVYGGDIWVVPKSGGTAVQVTHSKGEESWPKFSPDGKHLAFTAIYNGNTDVYVMPATGGVPTRVTYHTFGDRIIDWHPNGKQLLFASRREMGQRRAQHFFLVNKEGGMPTKLKIPYGELASFSPDGNSLAYITKITENYPFKRYRGGLTSDILIYNMKNNKVERITKNEANDGKPAWVGNKVFFLSDRGANMRRNVWVYDTQTKQMSQITKFTKFDITYLSASAKELVFEAGGKLYLMNAANQQYKEVPVNVVSDLSVEMPRRVNVGRRINNMTASPGGKRLVFEARGELFNVPAKDGYTLNMTKSSGAFDRDPAWSPDGKQIAFWSDRSGEYELYLQPSDGLKPAKKLTNRKKGFGYTPYWSPNSKKIAFMDETNTIFIIDAASGAISKVDNTAWNIGHNGRFGYPLSWSPDSRWLTYNKGLDNANYAIMIYDAQAKKTTQVTSGFYNDSYPVFGTEGKYLFYLTDRSFSPSYSSLDNTWVYPNSTQIASVSLTKKIPSLLAPKNDAVSGKKPGKGGPKGGKKPGKGGPKGKKGSKAVNIDFNDMEARVVMLPPSAGNYAGLMPFKGKLVFAKFRNTGAAGPRGVNLMYYDFKKRKTQTIMSRIGGATPTADNKMLVVRQRGKIGVIRIAPKQRITKPVNTQGMVMKLVPREEWTQIFNDTWRRHRDFFYDPTMHKLNWKALKKQYGDMLKDCRTRWDVTNLQTQLVSELSAGHTYTGGGDVERARQISAGLLGVDWELNNNKYRIKRIVKPAAWDTQVRSPFDRPGVDVNAGDYILSVNGLALDAKKDPFAAFEGLSGQTVTLGVSKTGNEADVKQVVVKCLNPRQESNLRYLEWVENNRKMVDKLSNGKLGYVYMSNTAGQGQRELVRMYYGQLHKKGFIIDERFNGGGQLADRFLELLKRPVVYNLHWRHGKDHTNPIKTNTGPMGMLINGWAGSGGDGLPWAFQELKAGPIVGERTLGILVGPATGHSLIDGGRITVPGARLYDNDGHWFWEGEGVRPDIKVWDDPNMLMQGRDPQMERVVQEVMKNLKKNPPKMTPAPPLENRTATGLRKK